MNRMSSFTKKFGQLQQWTAEKAGKAQKSEVDAEFKQLEQFADTKREVFEQLTADGKLLVQSA